MARRSYDREIRLERAVAAHDGLQKRAASWDPVAQVPARMKPGVGSERFANEQNAATAPAVFHCLFDPRLADLAAKDRLVDLAIDRVFDIQSVRWDGRHNSEMEILATARGA